MTISHDLSVFRLWKSSEKIWSTIRFQKSRSIKLKLISIIQEFTNQIQIYNPTLQMTIFASMIAVQNPDTKEIIIVQRDYELSSVNFMVRN